MFSKCGCLGDAWKMFNKMPPRNVVTRMSAQKWTILYDGYMYIYIYRVNNYLIEKLQATMWDTCWDLPYAQTFLNFILLHSSM